MSERTDKQGSDEQKAAVKSAEIQVPIKVAAGEAAGVAGGPKSAGAASAAAASKAAPSGKKSGLSRSIPVQAASHKPKSAPAKGGKPSPKVAVSRPVPMVKGPVAAAGGLTKAAGAIEGLPPVASPADRIAGFDATLMAGTTLTPTEKVDAMAAREAAAEPAMVVEAVVVETVDAVEAADEAPSAVESEVAEAPAAVDPVETALAEVPAAVEPVEAVSAVEVSEASAAEPQPEAVSVDEASVEARMIALQRKMAEFVEDNIEANFGFLHAALHTRDPGGLAELQRTFVAERAAAFSTQTQELARIAGLLPLRQGQETNARKG